VEPLRSVVESLRWVVEPIRDLSEALAKGPPPWAGEGWVRGEAR
jgi:hypothetical protein